MIKYADLTLTQKAFICDGCGGKGGLINPPEFLFHASCNHHDFLYWRGGTEEDRKAADDAFYELMKEDIAECSWYLRPHYHLWAYTYYKSVRLIGKKFFFHADEMKTMVDLVKEMRDASGV